MEAQHHTAEDILRALRFGVEYTFTIKVRQLEVVVRPLSLTERVRITNDVLADMSKLPVEQRTGLAESSLLAIRTIELATTPEPHSKVAPTLPAQLLERFTNDEVAALYKAYQDGLELLDPSMETLTTERLMELVAVAKKNPSVLRELPRPHLESIAVFLLTTATLPEASTSGGSSTTSPTADLR